MKGLLFFLLLLVILLNSCASIRYGDLNRIKSILSKDAINWTIDDCNKIIDFYYADNNANNIFQIAPIKQKVFIKVLPLNLITVQAIAKKETIEKRLKNDDYFNILKSFLDDYTSYSYDYEKNKIIEADSNFTNGYSFKVYFENISEPFEPIFIEDGYSYFFLENMNGDFSRVTDVSGLFVEDYFQLDGYLNAVLKFSPFTENSKRIFEAKDLNESYKLVFNGLQLDPVVIQWNIK